MGGAHIHWALAVVLPLAAAVVWGTFVAPKATRPVSEPVRAAIELAVLGCAVAALVVAGAPVLAAVFGVVAVVDGVAVRRLGRGAAG